MFYLRNSRMTCVDKVGVAMATQIFGSGPFFLGALHKIGEVF